MQNKLTNSPFLNLVSNRLRRLDYSLRTEQTYINWIKQYIVFNDKWHPSELGKVDMEKNLTHLAVSRQVSASTQNQALSTLVFMYKQVLDMKPLWMSDVVRTKNKKIFL